MWECSPSILSRILKNFSTDKGFVRKSCVVPGWFSFLLMILRDQSFPSHTTSEFLQLHTMSCRVAQEESVSPCRVNSKSSSLVIAYSRKSRYATDMSSKKVIHTIPTKKHVSTMMHHAFGGSRLISAVGSLLWMLVILEESSELVSRHLRSPNLLLGYRILAEACRSGCQYH